MKTFVVRYSKIYSATVNATSGRNAAEIAKTVLIAPEGQLLSVTAADYVESECPGCKEDPPRPPAPVSPKGGSPGTPVISAPPLVDQIAA